ncbi:MAG: hypothetical protein GDA43_26230 [Hormoscilla sp. SP5CHS1]|nr:hypothetical protein [Hormoscilla sp. SP5CHS1]
MSCVRDTESLYQTIVCFTALLERLNEAAEWQKPAAAGSHRAGKIGNLTSGFRPSAFDIFCCSLVPGDMAAPRYADGTQKISP